MKKFIINFVTEVTNCHPIIRFPQNADVSIRDSDWLIFEREGFKTENGNLVFPKFWRASFRPLCCSYSIYISKKNTKGKLITLNESKEGWELIDCCR